MTVYDVILRIFYSSGKNGARRERLCRRWQQKKVAPQSFRLSESIDPTTAKKKYCFFTTTAFGDKLRGKAFLNCYFLTNSLFLFVSILPNPVMVTVHNISNFMTSYLLVCLRKIDPAKGNSFRRQNDHSYFLKKVSKSSFIRPRRKSYVCDDMTLC
jgi:hypothetical protein